MSKKSKILIAIVFITVVLVLVTNTLRSCAQNKKVELQEQIALLQKEIIPMEFEISKKSNSEIKLKTVFYDLSGKKVGSQNIKLNGEELNFDFQVIKLAENSYLFFPCGIYTEQIALDDSIKVFESYDNKGFPAIYNGITDVEQAGQNKLNKYEKDNIIEEIKLYFSLTKAGNKEVGTEAHGVAVHDIKNITQFKKGFVYKVICHPHTGAIEIVRK